jgi:hypothetical protein
MLGAKVSGGLNEHSRAARTQFGNGAHNQPHVCAAFSLHNATV